MWCNPNEHDLVMRELRADAERDAARWRLIKSMKKERSTPNWLVRLRLIRHSRPERVPSNQGASRPASKARPSVSQSNI